MNEYYIKPFWQSKKWWSMVAGVTIVILAAKGVIPWEAVYALAPIIGYQISEGMADFGKNARKEMPVEASKKASPEQTPMVDIGQVQTEAKPISEKLETEVKVEKPLLYENMTEADFEKLTPEQCERVYLNYFERRLEEARKYYQMVIDMFHDVPAARAEIQVAEDMVKAAEHSLEVAKAMVEAVKKGTASPSAAIFYYIKGEKPPWRR